MTIKCAAVLAMLGLVGGLAQSASAASLYLTDVSPRTSMTVTFPGLAPETSSYVGQINWSFDRADPANAQLDGFVSGSTLSTFCIEGTQNVYLNATANFANIFPDIAQAPQDNAGNHFEMGSRAIALNKFWDVYYGQAGLSNANAAAFQLGMWEILYDGTLDLGNGAFKASATGDADSILALSQAQTWLGNFNSITAKSHYQLFALSDPNLQDQVFGVPTGGTPNPVPLPAALPAGLGMLGALGLWGKMRKR